MFMRIFLFILAFIPLESHAVLLLKYGLNYSTQTDGSTSAGYDSNRTFHKAFAGASVNGKKTLFFGWNINSWSSSFAPESGNEDSYSLLEMGPRVIWFTNENYNLYLSAGWNPYAKGTREKGGTSRDIQSGSSLDFAVGYRFRLGRNFGFGAGIHYHSLSITEEKVSTTTSEVSDTFSNIMPMLELTFFTR
jgi:hypothetical protein